MLVIILIMVPYSFIVLKYCRTFTTFEELVADYATGVLHPGDLKPALSKALNKILEVCFISAQYLPILHYGFGIWEFDSMKYFLLMESVVVICFA